MSAPRKFSTRNMRTTSELRHITKGLATLLAPYCDLFLRPVQCQIFCVKALGTAFGDGLNLNLCLGKGFRIVFHAAAVDMSLLQNIARQIVPR